MYFAKIKTDIPRLKEEVFRCIQQHNIKKALTLCDADPSPVAKILKAGILKYGETREDIKEAMEDVSLFEIPKMESRLSALATIANVTPLLGLLGTVTGMTGSFHTIQVQSASMNPVTPGDLAGGIWEALLSTVAGLLVAIPSFVAHNYFVSRVNQIVIEMERAATELVNLLSHVSEAAAQGE
jgi:biopolymer transport protein ExbB